MKKIFSLLVFVTLVPVSLQAQDLQVPIPNGWVNVTAKVTRNDTQGLLPALVAQAKNPNCKLLAADAKTLKDGYPVYLAFVQLPAGGNVSDNDQSFKEITENFEESVKSNPGLTFLGDKTATYGKKRVFRAEIEMPIKVAEGAPLVIHAIQYLIPYNGKAMLLVGYAPHSKWVDYKTIFDDVVTKMLE